MSDDILLKSVSNKRWVKKIINETYPQIKDTSVAKFLLNNNPIFFNMDALNIYLTTWKEQPSPEEVFYNSLKSEESIENFKYDTFFEDINRNNISYKNVSKYNKIISSPTSNVGRVRLLKTISINKTNGDTYLNGIIGYVVSRRLDDINNNEDFNKQILSSLKLKKVAKGPQYQYNLSNELYNFLLPYITGENTPSNNSEILYNNFIDVDTTTNQNNIIIKVQTDANLNTEYEYQSTYDNKKEKAKHQKSLQKYTVEIDNSPTEKEDVTMHILSKKGITGVLPFLYTSEVITDERARTYVDVCDMVKANVEKIEDNLYSSNFGKILKYNKSNLGQTIENSEEKGDYTNDREKLGAKDLKIATASLQDRNSLRKISVKVCDCYLNAMDNAKKKDFTSNYEDSAGLNYNLHLYLVEILSALAVCACPKNCTWQEKIPDSGLEKFKEHVGVSKDTSDFTTNCYISFPEASNFPLADSVIYINGIRTYLSTKGGAKAEGANPSIKSLSEFVYGEDGKTLTYLTESVMKKYPNEFNVFLELLKGSVSSMNFNKINSYIGCSDRYELEEWLKVNKKIMTEIVLQILQAQSFQFMQAKCKATSDEKDFHFDYSIQYPAVFDGDIDILFVKNSVRFHIANKELKKS